MARFTIAALAVCLLTACAGAGESGSAPAGDPGTPDRPLRGTTWDVTTLLGNQEGADEQRTSVDPRVAAADLTIGEDGSVTGSGGCNRLVGTATVREESANAATLTFQLGATRMLCAPEVMTVEDAVLAVLADDTEAVISGDTLTLHAPNGRGLILVAAPTPR